MREGRLHRDFISWLSHQQAGWKVKMLAHREGLSWYKELSSNIERDEDTQALLDGVIFLPVVKWDQNYVLIRVISSFSARGDEMKEKRRDLALTKHASPASVQKVRATTEDIDGICQASMIVWPERWLLPHREVLLQVVLGYMSISLREDLVLAIFLIAKVCFPPPLVTFSSSR